MATAVVLWLMRSIPLSMDVPVPHVSDHCQHDSSVPHPIYAHIP